MPRRKIDKNVFKLTPRVKRAPTAYNLFMKNAMLDIKSSNPSMNQKDVMKQAAAAWRASK